MTNPYQSPTSQVDTASAGNLSGVFERFTAWGVFGLGVVTLGLYPIYWLYSRTQRLNEHTSNPIPSGFINAALALYVIYILSNFITPFVGVELALILSLLGLAGVIMMVVWAFKFRNRLHEILGAAPGDTRWCNGFMVFFFSVIYLQYKINYIIDRE